MKEAIALEALAQALADKVSRGSDVKPRLRLVPKPRPTLFDSITRDSILVRIRRLQRMYQLQWLVEQSTFDTPGLETLEDPELSALLQEMERARECIVDGTPFDDAGLVRNTADKIPQSNREA